MSTSSILSRDFYRLKIRLIPSKGLTATNKMEKSQRPIMKALRIPCSLRRQKREDLSRCTFLQSMSPILSFLSLPLWQISLRKGGFRTTRLISLSYVSSRRFVYTPCTKLTTCLRRHLCHWIVLYVVSWTRRGFTNSPRMLLSACHGLGCSDEWSSLYSASHITPRAMLLPISCI